jgi:hypothetical protein
VWQRPSRVERGLWYLNKLQLTPGASPGSTQFEPLPDVR